jgi:hypothetical protein
MGSIASGIYGLFNDPTEKERQQMGSMGNYETAAGENLVAPAETYYEDILSGDQARQAQALAPEISAGQTEGGQAKKTEAEFGNRSGGTTGSMQAVDSGERGNIINLLGSQQSSAAAGAGSLGSNMLSQASTNVNDEANLANQRSQSIGGDIGGIVGGAAQIAEGFAGGGATTATGESDPYQTLYNAQNADTSGIQTQSDDLSNYQIGQ